MSSYIKRRYEDLSLEHLRAIAAAYGETPADIKKISRKPDLIQLIKNHNADFASLNHAASYHYFDVVIVSAKTKISYVKSTDLTQEIKNDAKAETAQVRNRNEYDEHVEDKKLLIREAIQAVEKTAPENPKEEENTPPIVPPTSTKKSPHLNIKLKYDPEKGIETFLESVETYADMQNLSDKKVLVKMALAVLQTTEYGTTIRQSLSSDDLTDWTKFKNKAVEMLGRKKISYRNELSTYKRKPADTPALTLGKITNLYRKAYAVDNDTALTTLDKDHIMQAFMNSLDRQIKGLLLAEEHNLSYETIAARTSQFETAYNLKPSENQTEKIMNVQTVTTNKWEKMMEEQNSMMKSLLSTLQSSSMNQKPTTTPFRRQFKINGKPVNHKEFNGYCIGFMLKGSCGRQQKGLQCNHKHQGFPNALQDKLKQKYLN